MNKIKIQILNYIIHYIELSIKHKTFSISTIINIEENNAYTIFKKI